MHSLIKFLGSIYTSFLFIITIIIIIINISMTYIKIYKLTYKDIDLNALYNYVTSDSIYDSDFKCDMIEYLTEYRDYIFSTKAYPNIDYSKYSAIQKEGIDSIRRKTNITYEKIIVIRKLYKYMTNNSVYLLVNIFFLICLLLITIRYLDIIEGIYFISLNVIIGSLIFLMFSVAFLGKVSNVLIIGKLINSNYINGLFKTNIIYMIVGVLLSASLFTYKIKHL